MKISLICTTTAALSLLAMAPLATASNCSSTSTTASAEKSAKNVVEIAAGHDSFKTLVTAVKAAGLAETLSGDGPFTIFAPTDDAFAKLPDGTVESLLKPENKAQLQAILTLHVLGAKVLAADVKPGMVKTLNGEEVEIAVNDGKVTVKGANVVQTDIIGTNGVIHVIDTVMLPAS
ncbi:MAG: fasciclin domain-containing protein [Verrucomicrobiales bacterium]|nr:fasciclin domain-containing protein [Verrucomicrobiota bacterium JB025]